MTARLLAQLGVLLIGVLAAVAPILQARSARKNLREDLTLNINLLKELPPGSRERGELTAHVERQFEARLRHLDTKPQSTLDAAALVFAAVSTAIGIAAIGLGGWWNLGLILAAVGLFMAAFADGTPTPPLENRPQDAVQDKPREEL
ncbi:hypothetical protein [Kribbella koreensis]|uniref:hypothetical protein n=1 Tax=Kribbella koreensis TaxID=57909 RepID=UPI0031E1258A